ncbi:Hypothetical protein PHPALM_5220 [Phytophthora palmivora]|uniref:DinB-like domain-containing protein n=1 Tax=Phytophthora palmivora TaxID=4796 RepID=A0A2P4YHV7_9STRA|nr:Hypothetical protein PHPALM_5220 [Phytophthora palmivora]
MLHLRRASASVRYSLSRKISTTAGSSGARACVMAILKQHKDFLRGLDDSVYTFTSTWGHPPHHLRKPLELLVAQQQGSGGTMVHYDIRDRHTPVEKDRHAAIEQIEQLEKILRSVPQNDLARTVHAAFMLSADGREFDFQSTFSRELAFAVHHCIHHNALSKVLLRHHFPQLSVPDGFGLAPSTANFNLTHE